MAPLSNLLRRGDAPAPRPANCRPAIQAEAHAALRCILGAATRPADDAHILDFLQFALQRQIPLSNLWLAERGGRIVWALLPIVSPGRTMLLLAPSHQPRGRDPGPGQLIEEVCTHFAARGVALAQALLDPADAPSQGLFAQAGFQPMAELTYLQGTVQRTFPPPSPPNGLSWVGYTDKTHALFGETVSSTYVQSMDCPALNGKRNIEDILAGHKSSGEFDPRLWFLLREGEGDDAFPEQALGVLLLTRMTRNEAMELVYLGLTPSARGRGLGDLLMRQALAATAAERLKHLSLAVDAENHPALRLYHRHGLHRVGQKLAMMRDLRPGATLPSVPAELPATRA